MKHSAEANLVTAELHEAMVKAVRCLKVVAPNYSRSRRSVLNQTNVWLIRFCNELRRLASEADDNAHIVHIPGICTCIKCIRSNKL